MATTFNDFQPYIPPIPEKLHAQLTLLLFCMGFLLFSSLLVYQLTIPKSKRSLMRELIIALMISLIWGFAGLFGMLWAGVYV